MKNKNWKDTLKEFKEKNIHAKKNILNDLKKDIAYFANLDIEYNNENYRKFFIKFEQTIEKYPLYEKEITEIFININPIILIYLLESALLSLYFSKKIIDTKEKLKQLKNVFQKLSNSKISQNKIYKDFDSITMASYIINYETGNEILYFKSKQIIKKIYKIWLKIHFGVNTVNFQNINYFTQQLNTIKPINEKKIELLRQCERYIFYDINYTNAKKKIIYYLQLYYIHIKYYPKIIKSKLLIINNTFNKIGKNHKYHKYFFHAFSTNKRHLLTINKNIKAIFENVYIENRAINGLYGLLNYIIESIDECKQNNLFDCFQSLSNTITNKNDKKFLMLYLAWKIENYDEINFDLSNEKHLGMIEDIFYLFPKSFAVAKLEKKIIMYLENSSNSILEQIFIYKNKIFFERLIIYLLKKLQVGTKIYYEFRNKIINKKLFTEHKLNTILLNVYDIEYFLFNK